MAAAIRSGALGNIQSLFDEGTCTGLSDARLLERFVTRDDEVAFAAMVERHGDLVRNTCQAVLKDPDAAADAFQATFVLLFRKAGSIRGGDALGAWLHRVAYRTALQARSDAARRREVEKAARLEQADEPTGQDDLVAALHEEIERLPERFRRPVVLCYLEGMTRDQAADYLRCTEGTVRGRLAKGRELLRHRLERRGLTLAIPSATGATIPESLVATTVRAAAAGASGPVAALVAAISRGGILARLAAAVVVMAGVGIAVTALAFYSAPPGRLLRGGRIHPAVAPTARPAGAIGPPSSDDRSTMPVEGRILDLEGRPVAGATITVSRVQLPDGSNLDAWIDRARRMERAQGGLRDWKEPGGSSATSGPDGRFRIVGLPRDAVVTASIQGPGIEASEIHVVTRDVPTFRLPLLPGPQGPINIYYGARFDHLAAPTRPIVGIVRDQDTGAPIPGVRITGTAEIPRSGIPTPGIEATTDAQGRYRLVGLPVARGFRLFTEAPGEPYVDGGFLCEKVAPGAGPFTFDIALKRGVLVRGRLTDKATGRPLRGEVFYRAFGDNPHLDEYPDFKRGSRGEPLVIPDDGRFTIPALPGRGLIAARAFEEGYLHGIGAEAIKGLDRRMNAFTTYPNIVGDRVYNLYVEINPAQEAQEVTLELQADPGRTARGTILGPDGRPLLGGVEIHLLDVMQGPQQTPADSAKFEVRGISPGPYRLDFFHWGRKLAGSLVLSGDESGDLTVRLQPWGAVVGRVVDEEGKPMNDVTLRNTRRDRPDPGRGNLPGRAVVVDAEGRFRIERIVPGIKYDADGFSRRGPAGGPVLKGVQVGPGEVKDLGDIRLPTVRKSQG
jgi:RNA polymerase sigma factor (sigma-70 family)